MDQTYQDKYYEIDGQKIHAVESGKPGRQVVLMLHGWSSSWYAVSPLFGLLAQRFHCIAIDLPGYGESPPFKEGRTTIPRYVELLADLIEQVSNGPVVLVGHSMGGMISITLALRYPILVERMVLLSPTISGRLSTFINMFITPVFFLERVPLGNLLVRAVEGTVVGLTDRLMRPASFAERSGIVEADYERIRTDARRPGQARARVDCYIAMRDNDLSNRLSEIDTPALILWGAEDNTVPLRDAGVVADVWPDADLRIIPNAGHWLHFETPDITRRQVAAYLGLPRSSSALYQPVDEDELVQIKETAQFLAHSAVGDNLNMAQRTRLAAQCRRKDFAPGKTIAHATDVGHDLFIIQSGTVEVWKDPEGLDEEGHEHEGMTYITTYRPGQITGELAMLDQGSRSADLIAGEDGAIVLLLNRERLLTLCEDDAVLGTRLLLNIATTMSRRVRFILWQLNRAEERQKREMERLQHEQTAVDPTYAHLTDTPERHSSLNQV